MRTRALLLVLGVSTFVAACASKAPAPGAPPSASVAPLPPSSSAPAGRASLAPAEIDRDLEAAWTAAGITPAPVVDDARFLRRVHLDLVGVIPPPDVVSAFLADKDPDKRRKMVDTLLASPRYAEHWANVWDRLLLGKEARRQVVDREAFHAWLVDRFQKNTPWNTLVTELVTATGRNTGRTELNEPTDAGDKADLKTPANPAVNYLLHFDNPADLTGTTSRLFLGVQIQCAQCHDHKTEKWKQTDFEHLAACFMQTRRDQLERGKGMGTRVIEIRDVEKPNAKGAAKAPKGQMYPEYQKAAPKALDGTDFSGDPSRRKALAAWMVSDKNPWFADAATNRAWAHLLGRGFTDPVDDIRPSNTPVLPELWKKLSGEFVASGYDLRALLRLVTSTKAYQRGAQKAATPDGKDGRLYARFRLVPMGPDELVDSLLAATNLTAQLEKGKGDVEVIKAQLRKQYSFAFDVDEEAAGDDDFDGTIPQVLMLLNGRLTAQGVLSAPGTALGDVLALPGDDAAKLRALYLRALSREPTQGEIERWTAFLAKPREWVTAEPPPAVADVPMDKKKGKPKKDPLAKMDAKKKPEKPGDPKRQAWEDVFWALLNSSEFLFNH